MKLEIDSIDAKQKILVVATEKNHLVNLLKSHLDKIGGDVYYSSLLPKSLDKFDICFFINLKSVHFLQDKKYKKVILVFQNHQGLYQHFLRVKVPHSKIIDIKGDLIEEDDIEKILWFSLSASKEKLLKLIFKKSPKQTPSITTTFLPVMDFSRFFKTKNIIIFLFFAVLISQLLFIFPLALTSYFSYKTFSDLKKNEFQHASDNIRWYDTFLKVTRTSYSFSRPTLLFLSLATVPDDILSVNEKAGEIFTLALSSQKSAKEILSLFLHKNKTSNEKALVGLYLGRLRKNLDIVGDDLVLISNKIPSNLPISIQFKTNILNYLDTISQIKRILPYVDKILESEVEKKYLLLFANNMELRPGGGFIGSFGILKIKDYTIEDIKIYDVYDADGQLKAHIEPPEAIRLWLGQPHWFLRDSAFSPDFLENYAQAKFFIEKELSITGFSGSILITTTGIENILQAFDNIYLPDFKENINSKNFYLKAQYYAEKNFFPGSIQKKTFLSDLMQQALINIDSVSVKALVNGVKKSLDEKQLIVYSDDQILQSAFESLFWSGRVIGPSCIDKRKNCLTDFIMPVDANLGVNKANFFITRRIVLKTGFAADGSINHHLSLLFRNESAADAFPGGSYKNYLQLYLPDDITINSITQNGIMVDPDNIKINTKQSFKVIGILLTVKPGSSTEIKINYQLNQKFPKGQGTYQLIVQKQIGSDNNDFISEIDLSKNYSLLSQNFVPLVKDNQILYNTYLSTDKIFFVELNKE